MSTGPFKGHRSRTERLHYRQLGGPPTATWGHQPHSFVNSFTADPSLLKRLTETAELDGHNGYVNAVQWNASGTRLVSGSDDCKIRIWDPNRKLAVHSFDSGHTANILDVKFLPNTNEEQLISCSGDWQVRHVNLEKSAVRPYVCHQGRVRSLVALDQHVFLSGSEDGTVRQFDTRERRPQPCNRQQTLASTDNHNVIVDQNERWNGKLKQKVGVNSVGVDPIMPCYLITGGGDAAVRLYDRRFLPTRSNHLRRTWPKWVSCYFPTHLKGGIRQQLPYALQTRHSHVTGVSFNHTGREIVASYSCEQIYSFDVTRHGRDPESLISSDALDSRNDRFAFARAASRYQPNLQRPPTGARSRSTTERRAGNTTATGHAVSFLESTLRMDLPEALEVVQAANEDPLRSASALRQGARSRSVAAGRGATGPTVGRLTRASQHQVQRPATGTPLPSPSRQSSGAQYQPQEPHNGGGVSNSPEGAAASSVPAGGPRARSPTPASVQHSRHMAGSLLNQATQSAQQRPVQMLQAQLTLIGAHLQLYQAARSAADAAGPSTAAASNGTDNQPQGPPAEQWYRLNEAPTRSEMLAYGERTQRDRGAMPSGSDARSVQATAHMQATASSDEEGTGAQEGIAEASAPRSSKRPRESSAAGPSNAACNSPSVAKRVRGARSQHAAVPPARANASSSNHRFPLPVLQERTVHQPPHQPHSEASAGQSHASWHAQEPVRRQVSITSPSRPTRSSPSSSDAANPQPEPLSDPLEPTSDSGGISLPLSTLAAVGRTLAIASGQQEHHPAASTGTSSRRRARRVPREAALHLHYNAARADEHAAGASGRVQTRPRSARTRPRTRLLETSFLLAAEDMALGADGLAEAATNEPMYPPVPPPRMPTQPAAVHHPHEVLEFSLHAGPAGAPGSSADDAEDQGRPAYLGDMDAVTAVGVSWNEVQDLFGREGPDTGANQPIAEANGGVAGEGGPPQQQEYSLLGHSGRGPSVVQGNAGPRETAQGRSINGGNTMEAMAGPHVRQNVPQNSHIGAIVLETDDISGEEVEESGMFLVSYSGHRNIMSSKPVSLLGAHSEYVLSGSDDGHVFIWEYATGHLMNMLGSDDNFVIHSVQPHPCDPVLATCGQGNIVHIWSPEAETTQDLQHAETVVQRNVDQVAEAAQFQGGSRPPWINIAGFGGPPIFIDGRGPTGRGGNPVRCNIM